MGLTDDNFYFSSYTNGPFNVATTSADYENGKTWGFNYRSAYGYRLDFAKGSDGQYWYIVDSNSSSLMGVPMIFPGENKQSKRKRHHLSTKKRTLMTKLNAFAKRILDSDTKTLIKAGLMDNDLQLTDLGDEEAFALFVHEKKKELVARAEEIIAESEKKNV